MYGPWSNHTGNHNALYPSSKQSQWEKSHLNMNAVANNWIKAGINRNKLVLSIAFHSLSFTLKDKNQHSTYSPVEGQLVGVLRYSEGDYIKSKGFFGVNVWHLEDDDIHGVCGTKQVLLKYLHEGLGNKVNFGN
ncbi:endochitinase-like isoform X2 [Leptinotarsa decemlineata]|uniref:endochitinase-like isoform X2 n=1 Tax=Leptinotarsa decemlineata TaxID=7539 RepID=UPI003D3058F7